MRLKHTLNLALLLLTITVANAQPAEKGKVWSAAKANTWYAQHSWINGSDYIASTAVNQLEMWQTATFDPKTIDKELGWAQNIGFNTMRVFLHSLAWKQDPAGFKRRIDQYLSIADRHHIQTIFVFFDDCWNADPKVGRQPEPKVGVHNSGWMQDPGRPINNSAEFEQLHSYVADILHRFGHDKRVLLWDLYNEPGNSNKKEASLPLLRHVFEWARQAAPDQPISAGLWSWDYQKLNAFQVANSDVITYHDYEIPEWHLRVVQLLKTYGRPVICTEYMARPRNSTFENTMPMLKEQHVGAINWGLVEGKTNTKYAWDTPMPDGVEPKLWFHEVFRKDGKPYREDEVNLIKQLNNK